MTFIASLRRHPAASLSLVVTVLAMIATPLFPRGENERQLLANVVVLGLLGVGVFSARAAYGARAVVAAGSVMVFTFGVELLGSRTGFPFGEYDYTTALSPRLGGVPLLVSCAWAAITLIVHGMFDFTLRSALPRVLLMAGSITAWDVFLDPQTLAFRGIPLVNYAGWIVTALVTSAMVVALCNRALLVPRTYEAVNIPIVAYAVLAVLSSIGFVLFFDDVVVAFVGATAMGCCLWIALALRTRFSGAKA
ncbi:MAG: hypothetical protein RIR87_958 [Actinomycetota bacterium]